MLEGCVFEINEQDPGAIKTETRTDTPAGVGEFTSGTYTHGALTRRFKLYTSPGQGDRPMPLVVMLHGCTQNPDDFAVGTGMNQRAREQGFCVLYPEQSQDANPSRCRNWFKHNHQQRGRGEPALLASMTQTMIKQHGIDPRRDFIAGLSAGGAMAAIVAAAYPEILAAVGVHSGLPTGGGASGSRVEQGVSTRGRRYTRSISKTDHGRALTEHWLVHGAGHAWSGGSVTGTYTDATGPDATLEMLRFFFEQRA